MTCTEVRGSAAAALLDGSVWDVEVREHVRHCAACRAELDELADVVALLALTGPDVIPPPEQPDPALLGRLLSAAAEQRRRRRTRTALAAAAALVLVVALGAGAVTVLTRPNATPAVSVSGAARDAATGVSGSATVTAESEGAQVAFTATGVPPGTVCTLQVVTRDGARHRVLTWTADYTSAAHVTGTAAVPAGSITRAELVDARGRLLLPVQVA